MKAKTYAGKVLDQILKENGDQARAIRLRFHPTLISRWKHCHRIPCLESAVEIAALTDRRITPEMWLCSPPCAPASSDDLAKS